MDESKFYIVLRDKEGGTFVNKRHATMEQAQAEAARLCRKESVKFYIAEVIAKVELDTIPVKFTALHG